MRNVGRWRNNRDCNSQRDKRKHISRRFQFGVYFDIPDKQNALFTIAENGRFLRNKALFSLSRGTFYRGIKHPSKTATSPMTARQPARAVFFQTAPQRTGAGFGGGRLNTDSAAPISLPPHAKRRRPPPLSLIRRDEQIFLTFFSPPPKKTHTARTL